MKLAAYICMFIFGFATLQPALSAIKVGGSEMECCTKGHCGDMPMKENKPKKGNCNPIMACSNIYYVLLDSPTISYLLLENRKKIEIIDDNRIANISSDMWHPPRFEL